ncbi:MAG: hypothetical protein M5R36_03125 [Deltaproteobacteria bacterium]|nr:hypothetical protein [Deltaproteobacteria bacterium]
MLTMASADASRRSDTFSGFLEHSRTRRRLSKKASGYLETAVLDRLFRFRAAESGERVLALTSLDETLGDRMEIAVYPRRMVYVGVLILGAAHNRLARVLDYLLKAAREVSFFASGAATCFCMAGYFRVIAHPQSTFGQMVMSIIVGILFGTAFATALDYGLRKPFYEFNRKRRYSLQ